MRPISPLTLKLMRTYLNDSGLRRNAIPKQLEIVENIPRNPSGKITKNVLQDQFKDIDFQR
ncbi:MAG: hypothetical protein Ct9H90mP5_01310 [Acidimicrobiaceae bacterium]|nr:MAG: hypothetical protein Ct9H90mP5_01310 [Acidimicrobiaceae bacterium]